MLPHGGDSTDMTDTDTDTDTDDYHLFRWLRFVDGEFIFPWKPESNQIKIKSNHDCSSLVGCHG